MRIKLLLASGLLMSTTIVTSAVISTQKVSALCASPSSKLVGYWKNLDKNTRGITRVSVGFACGDTVLCDTKGHCSQPYTGYTILVYDACHPTDCNWGSAHAKITKLPGEVLTASYTQSFAQRNILANINQGQLWLILKSHFTNNSGRPDSSANYYFTKAP